MWKVMEPNSGLDSEDQALWMGPYPVPFLHKHCLFLNLLLFFLSLLLPALPFPPLHLPILSFPSPPPLLLFPSLLLLRSQRFLWSNTPKALCQGHFCLLLDIKSDCMDIFVRRAFASRERATNWLLSASCTHQSVVCRQYTEITGNISR